MVRDVRPARFETHLLQLIRDDPQPTGAWTFAACGVSDPPLGVVLGLPTGALVYLQCAALPYTGDHYDRPEQPATGPAPQPLSMPVLPSPAGLTPLVLVERYLGALLTADTGGELALLELYADRDKPTSVPHGLTAIFHNGSRIFLYARHCVPAGRQLNGGEAPFRRRDSI